MGLCNFGCRHNSLDAVRIGGCMPNGLKEFKTIPELSIYMQQKFIFIEQQIKSLDDKADVAGKWIVRIAITITCILQVIILYKSL